MTAPVPISVPDPASFVIPPPSVDAVQSLAAALAELQEAYIHLLDRVAALEAKS